MSKNMPVAETERHRKLKETPRQVPNRRERRKLAIAPGSIWTRLSHCSRRAVSML